MPDKLDPASVAVALAGAVRMALQAAPAFPAGGAGKRYGIATAGQNGCSKPALTANATPSTGPLTVVERKIINLTARRPRRRLWRSPAPRT
jgi:uncharacterized membrane protein